MKKNYLRSNYIFNFINTKTAFLFYMLLSFYAYSQVPIENSYYKVLSYGDKIDFGNIEKGVTWQVSSSDAVLPPVYLLDNEINNFVFKKSGIYTIKFNDSPSHLNNECNHSSIPQVMNIKVSPINIKFDLTKVKLSQRIQVGRDCEGIIVTVPILVNLEGMESVTVEIPDFQIAGVGSNITAKLAQQEIVVKKGINMLTYHLSGVANSKAYLMLDFTDNNNDVHSYNYNELFK